MKIAVFLTGLIIDKVEVVSHIKTMFDSIAQNYNFDIDYYCHFWSSDNRYPYLIEDNITKLTVPWENAGSVGHALDILSPKNFKISNYTDMHEQFMFMQELLESDHQLPDRHWQITINENIKSKIFTNQPITNRFFVNNFPNDPEEKFDQWWHYHFKWCDFVHTTSQIYSSTEAMKLISQSNIEYDAVIKWRFDLLANYHSHADVIVNTIKSANTSQTYYTGLAWQGLIWKNDFAENINCSHRDKVVSIGDSWWITGNSVNTHLAYNLLRSYIETRCVGFPYREGGAHTWMFESLVNLDVNRELIGRIGENIIRFPDTIPLDFHENTTKYTDYLTYHNFKKKPNSDFKEAISHWGKRSKYHTAKFFDFY